MTDTTPIGTTDTYDHETDHFVYYVSTIGKYAINKKTGDVTTDKKMVITAQEAREIRKARIKLETIGPWKTVFGVTVVDGSHDPVVSDDPVWPVATQEPLKVKNVSIEETNLELF
jgi:hypothetical protein